MGNFVSASASPWFGCLNLGPPHSGHFQLQQNDHVNDVLVGILRYVYGIRILISILRFTLQYVVGYIHNLKMT